MVRIRVIRVHIGLRGVKVWRFEAVTKLRITKLRVTKLIGRGRARRHTQDYERSLPFKPSPLVYPSP